MPGQTEHALGRDAIAKLIPHQGQMCLLDRVVSWDATSISCVSSRHRDPANPLRRAGRLASIATVEFGLQAMAVHGALTAGRPQAGGFVISMRDVEIAALFADDLADPLLVEADVLAADRRACMYRFRITAGHRLVASGQAVIATAVAGP